MIASLFLGPPHGNEVAIIAWLLTIFGGIWILAVFSRWIAERIWKEKARMKNLASECRSLIAQTAPRLQAIPEAESSIRPAPDKWSKKEILGHLIDSASNNHQRFVRAQLSAEIKLPGYDQASWVGAQHYESESWEDLVHFWKSYNLHLLHVIEAIPAEKLNSLCFIGQNEPVTLEFLVRDYVRHLKHHLDQIFT